MKHFGRIIQGLMPVVLLAADAVVAAGVQHHDESPPSIHGVVRDAEGVPVEHAVVFLCDQATGMPIGHGSGEPLEWVRSDPSVDPGRWMFATTDADGTFGFTQIGDGTYRLVAQLWPDAGRVENPFEVNGLVVVLCGVAENVRVPGEPAREIAIGPMGTGTFVYHRGSGNDETFLFMSTTAPTADPILGPLGWKGPFVRSAIGFGRLPRGEIIVRGLPEKTVYYVLCAADNIPGFAMGAFRARNDQLHASDVNFVASWSDARHDPPPGLEPLCNELRRLMDEQGGDVAFRLLVAGREDAWDARPEGRRPFDQLFIAAEILGPLDREIELPSDRKATVADLMAAQAYVELGRRVAARKSDRPPPR